MTPAAPVPALKEWAVVVQALLAGEQVVDLRKGGVREPARAADGDRRRGFAVPATRCWLYPTAEHQRPELVAPAYRHWVDLAPAAPVGEPITLHGWAEVVEVATITEPDQVAALESKSVWTTEYAASRLRWKRRDPLWVLVLRAHRLDEPLTVPWSDAYGGCTSWVDLDGLPDPSSVPARPALSDEAFAARRRGVHDALAGVDFAAPAPAV